MKGFCSTVFSVSVLMPVFFLTGVVYTGLKGGMERIPEVFRQIVDIYALMPARFVLLLVCCVIWGGIGGLETIGAAAANDSAGTDVAMLNHARVHTLDDLPQTMFDRSGNKWVYQRGASNVKVYRNSATNEQLEIRYMYGSAAGDYYYRTDAGDFHG